MNTRKLVASSVLAVTAVGLIGYPAFAMFGDNHDTVADARRSPRNSTRTKRRLPKR